MKNSYQPAESGKKGTQIKHESTSALPLTRNNFIIMGVAGLLIVLGFIMMVGGGSDDPTKFNPDIFSNMRIVVGPLAAFFGFVLMGVGIIIRPRIKDNGAAQTSDKDGEKQ